MVKTMGMVVVAACAARADATSPVAAITATWGPTSSAARAGRPTILDVDAIAFDIADILQALTKGRRVEIVELGRGGIEKSDHRQRRLLRRRRSRPGQRAAESPNKFAALELIESHRYFRQAGCVGGCRGTPSGGVRAI